MLLFVTLCSFSLLAKENEPKERALSQRHFLIFHASKSKTVRKSLNFLQGFENS